MTEEIKPWFSSVEGIEGRLIRCADIETDGFNSTLIHVLSITEVLIKDNKPEVQRSFSVYDYDEIRELLAEDCTWIFHNGHPFDKLELERVLDCKMAGDLWDTLGVSWYLYPDRRLHGLGDWGEEFGIEKPVVEDWINITKVEVTHRCEQDVRIQTMLFMKQWRDMLKLYGDAPAASRCFDHLSFKMWCAALQSKARWKLDVPGAELLDQQLTDEIDPAIAALAAVMPDVPIIAKKSAPKKPFKMSGELSAIGQRWYDLCEEHGKDPKESGLEIKVTTGYSPANPGSPQQVKRWLYSLGWVPTSFKYVKDKDPNVKEKRKVEQIKCTIKDNGDLCDSVLALIHKEPGIAQLRDLGVLKNRRSTVRGWLKVVDKFGFIKAQIQGFTNTLRFKHKTCVNIPGVRTPWGKELRSLLISRHDGMELCGSDMESLEDRTKQHYMWDYDPDYVRDMMSPDFDPHLDMCLEAGMLTKEQSDFHKAFDKQAENSADDWIKFKFIDGIRHGGKQTNYSATYGAAGATIALAAGLPLKKGEQLHQAYWSRNWSLKAIAENCTTKTSRGYEWLWNPVAEMWLWLKSKKDKFSTLNQSTGTYCFDMWVKEILKRREFLTAQFHDEVVIELPVGNREAFTTILNESIDIVNDRLQLNRKLGVSVDYGSTYAEIH